MILEQNKYDVFISYTRADYVDENKNVIPGNPISLIKDAFDRAGITYWFDEEGVYAGDTFAPVIARAIHNCDVFLYVSSERSNASEWTSNEIATAYAYKKKIIPFRVDDSQYHESVIIFIAKLDYIDYASNPSRAISRLVSGVTEYLTHQKEMLAEKERKDKEERERLRLEKEKEQAELASEVELSARELNTDEGKAQDKRRRITRDVQKIEDEEIRNQLLELIDQSGPIHLAHKQERARLTSEIETLNEKVGCMNEEIVALKAEADGLNSMLIRQKKESNSSLWALITKRWGLLVTAIAIVLALLILLVSVFDKSVKIDDLRSQVEEARYAIDQCEATIVKHESAISNRDSTIAKYEEWMIKRFFHITSISFYSPATLYVEFELSKNLPMQNSNICMELEASWRLNVKAKETCEIIITGNSGRTSVDVSDFLTELLSKHSIYEDDDIVYKKPIRLRFICGGSVIEESSFSLSSQTIRYYIDRANYKKKSETERSKPLK